MLDNQLFQLILPIIIDGLTANSLPNVKVKQSFQPTKQGPPTAPAVYIYKIGPDHRYGGLKRADVWDEDTLTMIHTETQQYESFFQVNALVSQDPTAINGLTASDLVNIVAAIMQSDNTRNILLQSDVGIYRVEDVRNPTFLDDRDQFEYSPSFDFTLTHKQIITSTVPVVQSVNVGLYPY